MIKLENISRAETLRYLGGGNAEPDKRMDDLLDFCEAELKKNVSPKYLYKKIPVDSSIIKGEDIKKHLEGCDWCYVLCATLGAEADRLIRSYSVRDMSKAVALDAMSSAAVESVCNSIEEELARENPRGFLTWRFSPGYGDYPLEVQTELLRLLDAQKKIGLCADESFALTPSKSVTAVIGLSDTPPEKRRRGCAVCNLRHECKFRKAGTRCEF